MEQAEIPPAKTPVEWEHGSPYTYAVQGGWVQVQIQIQILMRYNLSDKQELALADTDKFKKAGRQITRKVYGCKFGPDGGPYVTALDHNRSMDIQHPSPFQVSKPGEEE